MKSIIEFVKKEFFQFKRDPKMFGLILIAPVIQLIFLGFAANLDVKLVRTIIYDQDKSSTSKDFIEELTSSGYFRIERYVNDYDEITNDIDKGKAILAIVIPNQFEKDIYNRRTVSMQALFNGSDGNTANISAGYLQKVVSGFSEDITINFLSKIGKKTFVRIKDS